MQINANERLSVHGHCNIRLHVCEEYPGRRCYGNRNGSAVSLEGSSGTSDSLIQFSSSDSPSPVLADTQIIGRRDSAAESLKTGRQELPFASRSHLLRTITVCFGKLAVDSRSNQPVDSEFSSHTMHSTSHCDTATCDFCCFQ